MLLALATTNQGKIREMRDLLAPLGLEVSSAAELGFTDDVEETGRTFRENAQLKACAVARALNLPALADDSGLAVDALDGAPGVHSARWSGGGDAANNVKLLQELGDLPAERRGAAFVCAMCCCLPDGRVLFGEGRLEGRIAFQPRGDHGFGYDPLFELPERGLTAAQLTRDQKNQISHRGQAIRALVPQLKEFLTA